jgi:hypothetical protein
MLKGIIFLAVLLMGSAVLADGYESYKDEGAPRGGYGRTAPWASNRACPAELRRVVSPGQCREILAMAERRRARRTMAYISPTRYRDTGRPARVRSRSRCAGYFAVEGDGRWTEGLARGAALIEWRKQVARSPRAGEAFMDERYAQNFRVYGCKIASLRGLKKTCKAEGVACQP